MAGPVASRSGLCDADAMSGEPAEARRAVPWSARAPQRYVFAAIAVVVGIALVVTAVAYIRSGVGGVVPYLMITVGPVLAVVYVYYFGFRDFEAAARSDDSAY